MTESTLIVHQRDADVNACLYEYGDAYALNIDFIREDERRLIPIVREYGTLGEMMICLLQFWADEYEGWERLPVEKIKNVPV